jgi:hypothetical protein
LLSALAPCPGRLVARRLHADCEDRALHR